MAKGQGRPGSGSTKTKTRNPDRPNHKAWAKHTKSTGKKRPPSSRNESCLARLETRHEIRRMRGETGLKDTRPGLSWEAFERSLRVGSVHIKARGPRR